MDSDWSELNLNVVRLAETERETEREIKSKRVVLTIIPVSIEGKVGIEMKTVDVPKETWIKKMMIKYEERNRRETNQQTFGNPARVQIQSGPEKKQLIVSFWIKSNFKKKFLTGQPPASFCLFLTTMLP